MWLPVAVCVFFVKVLPVLCHRGLSGPPLNTCVPEPSPKLAFNLIVKEGQSAALQCELDARWATTTWAHMDTHRLLTMAINSYVHRDEPRYRLVNATSPWPHWVLLIEKTRASDSGLYRCSVSYESGHSGEAASVLVRLTVIPQHRTVIGGGQSRHVHSGQQLRISCIANASGDQPVTWTRDGLDLKPDLGRTTVVSSKVCSVLTVNNVKKEDGGTYSCNMPGLQSDNVKVRVVPEGGTRPVANGAASRSEWACELHFRRTAQLWALLVLFLCISGA